MADQTSETAKRPHVEAESESIVEPTNGHASKKPKLDQVGHMNNTTDEHTGVITSFGEFRTTKVLNEDSQWKSMVLLGRFGKSDKDAVVILNKTPLSEELAKEMLTETSVLRNIMQNDIYGTYELLPKQELNGRVSAFNSKLKQRTKTSSSSSRGRHILVTSCSVLV